MTMTFLLIIGLVAVVLVAYVLPRLLDVYRRSHGGTRLVTCPETKAPAAVGIDVAHAALTALTGGTEIRLDQCSRWPERQGCGQECLEQVGSDPEGCLVRTIVKQWYTGKTCTLCDASFDSVQSFGHSTALLGPDGATVEWRELPSELLPKVFQTHRPVCWNCHIAERFRREHPELVIDRRVR